MIWEIKFLTERETLATAEFEGEAPGLKEVKLGPAMLLHYKAKDDDSECGVCGRLIWRKRMVWTDRERFHKEHEWRCTNE